MATPVKYDSGILHIATDINVDTDTFKIALTNTTPNHGTHESLSDINEIASGNGYVSGGVSLDLTASQASGVLSLNPDGDKVFTASGGDFAPFRYAVIYSDTPASKPLLCSVDYGESITVKDGETLTIDLPTTLITLG